MKRYLWTAMVLVFLGANASDNPFDLSVNLKKIDQDQDALLSELRNMAEAKEAREEKTEEENIEKVEKVKVDNATPVSKKDKIEVDNAVSTQAKVTEEEKNRKLKELQRKKLRQKN